MFEATYNGTVIARSEQTVLVEGNHYFPPQSLVREHIVDSETQSRCPWKGTASYYHVEVAGQRNEDAAWYYPKPKAAAREIQDHVAFWRGVEVRET